MITETSNVRELQTAPQTVLWEERWHTLREEWVITKFMI